MGPFEIGSISSTTTIGKRTDHYITKNSLHLQYIRPLFNNDPILPMQTVFTDADGLPPLRRSRNTQKRSQRNPNDDLEMQKPNPPKTSIALFCVLETWKKMSFSRGNTKTGKSVPKMFTRGVRKLPPPFDLGVCKTLQQPQ